MKLFLIACLVAAAFAEPESDPGYVVPYSHAYPYAGYASPYVYNAHLTTAPYVSTYATHYPFSYYNSFYNTHLLKKRDAEAEADPFLLYSGTPYYQPYNYNVHRYSYPYVASHFPYASVYHRNAYLNHAVSGVPYADYGRYVASNPGATHIAKREAESSADPAVLYGAYSALPYYNRYSTYSSYPYAYSAYRPAYTSYYNAYAPYRYLY